MSTLIRSKKARGSVVLAIAAVSLGLAAAPASAQQEGLINVAITDNTVQVPISVAAAICNTQVAVLAQNLEQGNSECDVNANSEADAVEPGGDGAATPTQTGLVNVAIVGNTVQVPVGIGAALCNTQVGLLAQDVRQGDAACTAEASSRARGPRTL